MPKHLAALLLAGLAASAAHAQTYTRIDPGSSIRVTATEMGVVVPATLQPVHGSVHFDPAAAARARFALQVDTAAITTGNPGNDTLLRGPDWLDVKAHPQASFSASALTPAGPGRWWVSGTLTLKGQSRPLKVLAVASGGGQQLTLDADTTLDRLSWKLGVGDWADTSVVAAALALHVHLVLDPH